jgi:hypothetical protein
VYNLLALTRLHDFAIVEIWREWATAGKDCLAIGIFHSFLVCTLGVAGWVRKREDDWVWVQFGHSIKDRLVKNTTNRRQSHQNCRLYKVDNLGESLELLTIVVITREVYLVLSKLISSVVGYETL